MQEIMTQEYLKSILRYNPSTGIWKWRKAGYGRPKNKIAGCKKKNGYVTITHNNKKYQVHRLAFLYISGYLPENFVDHINRNPSDNRWDNLREVSVVCNAQNRTHVCTNVSGVTGVSWRKNKKAWIPMIRANGRNKYLGYFKNLDDAVMARWEAEVKYNYSGCNENSESYLYLKERNLIP